MPNNNINGGGPWQMRNERTLSPDDSMVRNLFDMKFRGQKGYFRDFLPLDNIQITNKNDTNPVNVVLSNNGELYCPPSTVEGLDDEQITSVSVTNNGTSDIPPGDLVVELRKARYGINDQARKEAEKPQAIKMLKEAGKIFL